MDRFNIEWVHVDPINGTSSMGRGRWKVSKRKGLQENPSMVGTVTTQILTASIQKASKPSSTLNPTHSTAYDPMLHQGTSSPTTPEPKP